MIKRSYYTALLFQEDPALHMTLWYRSDKGPLALAKIIEETDRLLEEAEPTLYQHKWRFGNPKTFGFRQKVRALVPLNLYNDVPKALQRFTPKDWHPHVTTEHQELRLTSDRIAIMHKKEIITAWHLPVEGELLP